MQPDDLSDITTWPTKHDEADQELIDSVDTIIVSLQVQTRDNIIFDETCYSIKLFSDLAKEHFSEEESKMEQAGFPALEVHRKTHLKLLLLITQALEMSSNGCKPEELNDFFCDDLRPSLVDHIKLQDQTLLKYLSSSHI